MKKKKLPKSNPIAKNMHTGETGFKQQTQTHKAKNKYDRKTNKKILKNIMSDPDLADDYEL